MASIRTTFEKELRSRLNQKATARSSEEQILMKAFKYFDLNNSGDVTFDEFVKAVEKIGLQTFSQDEFQELFEFYDTNHNGALDYKEFSGIIFGNASGVSRQMSPQKESNKWGADIDEVQVLLEKLKKTLASRGPGGIVGLGKQFRIADDDNSRSLDQDEFRKAMRDFGTGFKDDEIARLFEYFDRTKDGLVNFDEFIYAIRGQMNNFRKNLVLQAFTKLDKDISGDITIEDLVDVYNGRAHPDVKAGRKTEKQVLAEFLDTFHGMYDFHAIHDDKVTQEEFLEYYAFISASIDNDQYFELMMNNAWRMNEGANKNWETKGWAGNSAQPAKAGNTSETKQRLDKRFGGEEQKTPRDSVNASRPGTASNAPYGTSSNAPYGTSSNAPYGTSSNAPYGTSSNAPYGTSSNAPYGTSNNTNTNGNRRQETSNTSYGNNAQTQSRPQTAQSNRSQTGLGGRPQTAQTGGRNNQQAKALVEKFQEKILARGARGIFGLQRLFKIIDDDNSKELDKTEFSKCLKDFRLDFSPSEASILFDYFDETHNGSIDYDEFLHIIRGEINQRRLAVIKQAFTKLDKTGDGVITLDDIRGVYIAKNHPDVKSGKRTEDEILGDFLDTFEQYHSVRNDDPKLRNKEVTFDEFVDYYRNVSCSIDSDEYFELMIKNAWNLENRNYGKGWASKY